MKEVIGGTAGEVWRYLFTNGDVTFASLKNGIRKPNQEVFMALGWLSREGKVEIAPKGKSEINIHLTEK